MVKKFLASIGDRLKYVNMTDINRDRAAASAAAAPEAPADGRRDDTGSDWPAIAPTSRHDALLTYVELLFFAYRDFTGDPDSILQQLGFGRAHHRVLHFVRRYPGLRVAELLQILKITKQSFSRVLRDLVVSGHIERRTGASDRRERLLFATPKGAELADRLARPQIERIAAALAALDESESLSGTAAADHEVAPKFLYLMINAQDRGAVDALMRRRRTGLPTPAAVEPASLPARPGRATRRGAGAGGHAARNDSAPLQQGRQRKGTA